MSGHRRRWGRILLATVAILAVALLGWLFSPRRPAGRSDASPSMSASPKRGEEPKRASGSWRGLKSAGVPLPGEWSADKAYPSKANGRPNQKAGKITLGESYGPLAAALRTLDALTDRSGSNEQWGLSVSATVGPDGAGQSHSAGDAPRWWFAGRHFDAAQMCHPGDALDGGGISPAQCAPGSAYPGGGQAAILVSQYYQPTESQFPVPSGLRIDSLTDPQEIVRQSYATAYVPMDDGIWTITSYCPASDPRHPVAVDKNNTETAKSKDAYWPAAEPVSAFGTRQRPCRTVEYTVGSQRPFWYTGAAPSDSQQ